MIYDFVIIGGGASGLMLAANLDITAAGHTNMGGQPLYGLIIEKTARLGTKLLMSGGGHCNITHGGSIKDFISAYGSNGSKLRKCLYRHSNTELAAWLEDSGISLADENGCPVYSYDLSEAGRIFPASMRASDILELLLNKTRNNGWEIQTGTSVISLAQFSSRDTTVTGSAIGTQDESVPDGKYSSSLWEVGTESGDTPGTNTILARNVIIAAGGITYPKTGSDGSMLEILKSLGVQIISPRSALAPIAVENYPYEELSGVSIPDVAAMIFKRGVSGVHLDAASEHRINLRQETRMTGDLLFTHRGFSGPVILNISRYAEPGDILSIRYNKELTGLPRRLQRILEHRSCGPSGDIRTTLLDALLGSDDFIVSAVDAHGMATAGGISLEEIDMKTMQLSRYPGLFAIGEAIDADGITGGYNLQMCWSTARAAADSVLSR